jgi:hypothetical protein
VHAVPAKWWPSVRITNCVSNGVPCQRLPRCRGLNLPPPSAIQLQGHDSAALWASSMAVVEPVHAPAVAAVASWLITARAPPRADVHAQAEGRGSKPVDTIISGVASAAPPAITVSHRSFAPSNSTLRFHRSRRHPVDIGHVPPPRFRQTTARCVGTCCLPALKSSSNHGRVTSPVRPAPPSASPGDYMYMYGAGIGPIVIAGRDLSSGPFDVPARKPRARFLVLAGQRGWWASRYSVVLAFPAMFRQPFHCDSDCFCPPCGPRTAHSLPGAPVSGCDIPRVQARAIDTESITASSGPSGTATERGDCDFPANVEMPGNTMRIRTSKPDTHRTKKLPLGMFAEGFSRHVFGPSCKSAPPPPRQRLVGIRTKFAGVIEHGCLVCSESGWARVG